MYQNLVRNEDGEPMYVENVLDPQEQEEAYWEEMQHRADDPFYAEQCENESWYNRACAIFEAEGIEVPEQVKRIFADESRKKRDKMEEEKALKEVQPVLDYLKEHLPCCGWYVNFFHEGYDEIAHVEFGCEKRPYIWELKDVIEQSHNDGFFNKYELYIEDYVGESDCAALVSRYRTDGYQYAKYVRNWIAEERCGNDMLFAIRRDWLDRDDIPDKDKYLVSMVAISPVKDNDGNDLWDAFRKKYPNDKYIVWSGEIRHNGKFNDTICFCWS